MKKILLLTAALSGLFFTGCTYTERVYVEQPRPIISVFSYPRYTDRPYYFYNNMYYYGGRYSNGIYYYNGKAFRHGRYFRHHSRNQRNINNHYAFTYPKYENRDYYYYQGRYYYGGVYRNGRYYYDGRTLRGGNYFNNVKDHKTYDRKQEHKREIQRERRTELPGYRINRETRVERIAKANTIKNNNRETIRTRERVKDRHLQDRNIEKLERFQKEEQKQVEENYSTKIKPRF